MRSETRRIFSDSSCFRFDICRAKNLLTLKLGRAEEKSDDFEDFGVAGRIV